MTFLRVFRKKLVFNIRYVSFSVSPHSAYGESKHRMPNCGAVLRIACSHCLWATNVYLDMVLIQCFYFFMMMRKEEYERF